MQLPEPCSWQTFPVQIWRTLIVLNEDFVLRSIIFRKWPCCNWQPKRELIRKLFVGQQTSLVGKVKALAYFLWRTPLQIWSRLIPFLIWERKWRHTYSKLPVTTLLAWKMSQESLARGAGRVLFNPWSCASSAGRGRNIKNMGSKREWCVSNILNFIIVFWMLKFLSCNSSLNVEFYKEVWFASVLKATV